jgi:hypothetical protein
MREIAFPNDFARCLVNDRSINGIESGLNFYKKLRKQRRLGHKSIKIIARKRVFNPETSQNRPSSKRVISQSFNEAAFSSLSVVAAHYPPNWGSLKIRIGWIFSANLILNIACFSILFSPPGGIDYSFHAIIFNFST